MVQFGAGRGAPAKLSAAFVGRDAQLALARRRWDAARAGVGHFLLVAGEAGIGKSRLLAELTVGLAETDTILSAAAFPRETQTTGGVLLNLADALARAGSAATAEALRARVLSETTDAGDPLHRRRMLLGDLADLLSGILAAGPTLLMIEDLHWADELSLDVLDRLPDVLRSTPGMVVATYRSDELYPQTALRRWRARLLEQRRAEEVRLPRLDLADLAVMTEGMTGVVPASGWLESLHRRSDGIPLHVEELVVGGGFDFVPDTVAEAAVSRVRALDAATQEVVEAASVIGRSFDLDLLAAIVGGTPESIDDALRELADHYLVLPRGDGSTFDFRHMLIRDAIYDDISPIRRRRLHAAAASAASGYGFRDAYLSDQYERAHLLAEAYAHALAAADEARSISSHREAAELYARVLRTEPPSVADRQRADTRVAYGLELAAVDDNAGSLEQWRMAARLYGRLGDSARVAALAANLMAARHLLGADLAERIELGRAGLRELDTLPDGGDLLVRAEVLGAMSAAYMLDRRLEEAITAGTEARALATGAGGRSERLNIDFTLGTVLVFAGRADEGWGILEEAIAAGRGENFEAETARGYRMLGSTASVVMEYDRAEKWIGAGLVYCAAVERWNDYHYLLAHRSHVRWAVGEWAEALVDATRALADGSGITTRITALITLGYLALGQGRFADAHGFLDEARELGEQMGELQRYSPALWGLAELALAEGDGAAAVELGRLGLERSTEVGDAAYAFPFVVTGTRALLVARELGAARTWLTRCEALLELRQLPGTRAALDHARGLILLAEGQTGQARIALEEASVGWGDRRRFWEGEAAVVDRAACAVRSRRPADALVLVERARTVATSVGAVVVLSSIAQLSIHPHGTVGTLTSREYEVARLVASGSTNREIATTLVIAPKTVSAHVEHILAKLGASRRAEIAAWVSRTMVD